MTDPISDMLNRIMSAQAVFKETVQLPFSNLKNEIALVLEKKEFVGKVEKKGRGVKKILEISLKYKKIEDGEKKLAPAIIGVKRISKPGQKIYLKRKHIKTIRNGYGIAVISTSKGIMTDRDARNQKIGGEVLCEVW